MFQLTKEEYDSLKCQNGTSNTKGGDRRALPYAFIQTGCVWDAWAYVSDLVKHNVQYPAIDFIQLPHRNHDRFLIIDDKVYFMGASLKDMGAGLCAITEMLASPETIIGMLK